MHRLNSSEARGIFSDQWSPALTGRVLSTAPPGKSLKLAFFLDYFPFFQKKDETIYKTKKGLYSLPQVKIPNFPKYLHRNKAKVKVAIKTFKFTQLELTLVYESPSHRVQLP